MRRCCLLFILVSLMSYGQNPARVDFTYATVSIHPDSIEKSIKGSVVYTFEVLHKTDSVYLDAIDTHFNKIMVNGKAAPYSYNGSKISVLAPAQLGTHKLKIDYEVRPKQTVYFLGC